MKRHIMKRKKGMSPLIATVLLIGFAVALAALVMTWGLDFIKGQTGNVDTSTDQALKCVNQLDFKLEVDCGSDRVAVDNRGSIDITSLTLRKHKGTGDVIPVKKDALLRSGEKRWFDDLKPLNNVSKVDAVATIKGQNGKDILCSAARRELDVKC